MAAGAAQLRLLRTPGVYEQLDALAGKLCDGIGKAASENGVAVYQTRVGSMFTTFFTSGPVVDEASAKQSDTSAFATFFRAMLDQGIYLAPSQFEAGFLSLAHSEVDIERTIAAAHVAFQKVMARQE